MNTTLNQFKPHHVILFTIIAGMYMNELMAEAVDDISHNINSTYIYEWDGSGRKEIIAIDILCGINSACLALRAMGIEATYEDILRRQKDRSKWMSISNVISIIGDYGVQAVAVEDLTPKYYEQMKNVSMIAWVKNNPTDQRENHFIYFHAAVNGHVYGIDPPATIILTYEELDEIWNGIGILIAKDKEAINGALYGNSIDLFSPIKIFIYSIFVLSAMFWSRRRWNSKLSIKRCSDS